MVHYVWYEYIVVLESILVAVDILKETMQWHSSLVRAAPRCS